MIDASKEYRFKDNENETCEIIEVVGNEVKFSYMVEVPSIIDGVGDLQQKTDVMLIDEFLELWEVVEDGWISVDDQLPSRNGEYLVYVSGGYISIDEYCDRFHANKWGYYTGHDGNYVTHWLPLPQKPSEIA